MASVIVVGSGSAGSVLAARLTEDPDISVLVLEAGPYYPFVEEMPEDVRLAWRFGGMAHDWGYTAAGVVAAAAGAEFGVAHSGAVPVPRGKVVGGSSSVNVSRQWAHRTVHPTPPLESSGGRRARPKRRPTHRARSRAL